MCTLWLGRQRVGLSLDIMFRCSLCNQSPRNSRPGKAVEASVIANTHFQVLWDRSPHEHEPIFQTRSHTHVTSCSVFANTLDNLSNSPPRRTTTADEAVLKQSSCHRTVFAARSKKSFDRFTTWITGTTRVPRRKCDAQVCCKICIVSA